MNDIVFLIFRRFPLCCVWRPVNMLPLKKVGVVGGHGLSFAAPRAAADRRGKSALGNFLVEFIGFAAVFPFEPYSKRSRVCLSHTHHALCAWWADTGSNRGPSRCKRDALTN